MLSWNIWYSDLLSHWVSDISTYLIFCLVWRSVNLWICWAETSDLLIYWVSEFSAHMIFWNTGSLTFLKVCRSVDMLGWNLWHSDLLSHWVSEISAYMVFWQTGSLTFLKFWAETSEIFSEITVYMIFWYTGSLTWSGGLGIWEYAELKHLTFWFSGFLMSEKVSSEVSEHLFMWKFWLQKNFRSSEFLSSCWCQSSCLLAVGWGMFLHLLIWQGTTAPHLEFCQDMHWRALTWEMDVHSSTLDVHLSLC